MKVSIFRSAHEIPHGTSNQFYCDETVISIANRICHLKIAAPEEVQKIVGLSDLQMRDEALRKLDYQADISEIADKKIQIAVRDRAISAQDCSQLLYIPPPLSRIEAIEKRQFSMERSLRSVNGDLRVFQDSLSALRSKVQAQLRSNILMYFPHLKNDINFEPWIDSELGHPGTITQHVSKARSLIVSLLQRTKGDDKDQRRILNLEAAQVFFDSGFITNGELDVYQKFEKLISIYKKYSAEMPNRYRSYSEYEKSTYLDFAKCEAEDSLPAPHTFYSNDDIAYAKVQDNEEYTVDDPLERRISEIQLRRFLIDGSISKDTFESMRAYPMTAQRRCIQKLGAALIDPER